MQDVADLLLDGRAALRIIRTKLQRLEPDFLVLDHQSIDRIDHPAYRRGTRELYGPIGLSLEYGQVLSGQVLRSHLNGEQHRQIPFRAIAVDIAQCRLPCLLLISTLLQPGRSL